MQSLVLQRLEAEMRTETMAAGWNDEVRFFDVKTDSTAVTITQKPRGPAIVLPANTTYREAGMRMREIIANTEKIDATLVQVWLDLG
jgi:hypothetical protein